MFGNYYQGKNVFVTGHTGFKGSWLSAWLLKLGANVTGYALPPLYDESHFELLGLAKKVRHIEGDVRDRDHLTRAMTEAKPDIVFHLAAQALVREAYRDPHATFETNVMGGVNVCEAVGKAESVRTLVYITSDKCYRNVDWEWGYRETDILGGRDPYSASKGCAELVFAAYWTSFLSKAKRVNAASTRAGNVIGGGDWAKDRLIPDCVRALRKKETIEIHHPESTRPWQHVLEPLGGYLHLGRQLGGAEGCGFLRELELRTQQQRQQECRRRGAGRHPPVGQRPGEDRARSQRAARGPLAAAQLRPRQPLPALESDLELPRFDRRDGELVSPLSGGRRHPGAHRFADREVRPRLEGGGP